MNQFIFSKKLIFFFLNLFFSIASWSATTFLPAKVKGQSVVDNKNLTIDTENKKGLVVIFLSALCPCSSSHIPELKDLAAKYSEYNFVAVHSNPEEKIINTQKYFIAAKLPFPVIQDDNTRIADNLGATKTPEVFIVLSNGDIVYRGGISDSNNFRTAKNKYLRKALSDLEQGKEVQVADGKFLGCSIKNNFDVDWR